MFKTGEIIALLIACICLLILQHEIYKQDISAAKKHSYKEGYYAGLYTNVIKHSSKETD